MTEEKIVEWDAAMVVRCGGYRSNFPRPPNKKPPAFRVLVNNEMKTTPTDEDELFYYIEQGNTV